jgi:hypothetical protein
MLYYPQTLSIAEYYNKRKLPHNSTILVLHPTYQNIRGIVLDIQESLSDDDVIYLIPQGSPHTSGILFNRKSIVCIDSRAPDQYITSFKDIGVFAVVEYKIGEETRAIQSDKNNCAVLQLCIAKTLLKNTSNKKPLALEVLDNALKALQKGESSISLPSEVFKYAQSNKLVRYLLENKIIAETFDKNGQSVNLLEYREKYDNKLTHYNEKLIFKEAEFVNLAKYDAQSQKCNV